ncbi:MAG: tRNA lysidine(34) synthetase TilS [Myxococcota bacterium]
MDELIQIEKTVENNICSQIPENTLKQGIILAVSGGADSMALLYLVNNFAKSKQIPLKTVTIDHGQRTEAGKETQEVVRRSELLGIEALSTTLPLENISKSLSENSMRSYRREILIKQMQEAGFGCIALGHNLQDQGETLLMKLIRGAGSRGLSAMAVYEPPFLRPLLNLDRSRLEFYLNSTGVDWFEDRTNTSLVYFRNRVRNIIVPALKQENPKINRVLFNTTLNLKEEHEALTWMVNNLLTSAQKYRQGMVLPLMVFSKVPSALVKLAVAKIWKDVQRGSELGRKHLDLAARFISETKPGKLQLPGKTYLYLLKPEPKYLETKDCGLFASPFPDQHKTVQENKVEKEKMGGTVYCGPKLKMKNFSLETDELTGEYQIERGVFSCSPCQNGEIIIPDESNWLQIRNPRPGDRISRKKMGMVRLKKALSRFPAQLRQELLCITDEKERILWMEGAGRAWGIEGNKRYKLDWLHENYNIYSLISRR